MLLIVSSIPPYLTEPHLRTQFTAPKTPWHVICLNYSVYAILTLVILIAITTNTAVFLTTIIVSTVLALLIGHLAHYSTSLTSVILVLCGLGSPDGAVYLKLPLLDGAAEWHA